MRGLGRVVFMKGVEGLRSQIWGTLGGCFVGVKLMRVVVDIKDAKLGGVGFGGLVFIVAVRGWLVGCYVCVTGKGMRYI